MNKIMRVLIRIPFREIWIFWIGFFSAMWCLAFFQINLLVEVCSGIGIIIAFYFAVIYNRKSHEEKEMIEQWKNAKRMSNGD